jgi:hypothetical protein
MPFKQDAQRRTGIPSLKCVRDTRLGQRKYLGAQRIRFINETPENSKIDKMKPKARILLLLIFLIQTPTPTSNEQDLFRSAAPGVLGRWV